jgi:hypothetical protein
MNYRRGEDCFWTRHMRAVWRNYQEHPEAPPMYGWWDSFPGRAEGRGHWFHHFDLYRPMVSTNTCAWIDIADASFLGAGKTDEVVASLFVNDDTYLVIANYGATPATVQSAWRWLDRQSGTEVPVLSVPPRGLAYYQRMDT